MGSGKTTWALNYINEAPEDKKFIYITPFLSEVDRVLTSVKKRKFIQPNNKNTERRKLRSLKELIVSGMDIVATHSLFQTADDELIELLTGAGYTLILDEVMDVIEQADISKLDIRTLLTAGHIEVIDDKVHWITDEYVDGRFMDIKLLAKAGNLFMIDGEFLIWCFPPKVFEAFDSVITMTYLFNGQLQRCYFDLYKIPYEYKAVNEKFELIPYEERNENRADLFQLIDLCIEEKFNDIGKADNAFGARWLRNASGEKLIEIKKHTYTFFRSQCKAKGNEIMWSTLKEVEPFLKGRGYAKSSIAVNSRATNEYSDRWALAYLFNRFMRPHEVVFFRSHGVSVDVDMLAVSDLLQWIWRSRIRNGEPIKLYLPSSRMRSLLKAWANYEI
jgi:hypothetical protein